MLPSIKLHSKSLTSSPAEWHLNIQNKAFKTSSTDRHFCLWRAGQDEMLTLAPWRSFLLLLVSTGRKLNTQSKWREPSAHSLLSSARPPSSASYSLHFSITIPTLPSPAPAFCRDPKTHTQNGIKWEQPQTYPRKPGIKLILELLVPPAHLKSQSRLHAEHAGSRSEMCINTLGASGHCPSSSSTVTQQPSPHFHPNPSP